ncbi:uncharacterized membrane protein YcaP (DUF421 family) [Caldalkalibacillus uzonensis]|uniref:Uncharacterized membrane protein YcaP (DUF421 family) n=1 Tax=Caldalkalibacillus uzonensis TaxID=353224 RepID=A0ABU0CMD4_9BACI|nr:DUF421 domain-containing protein [Caldalkalibacillus uzonensis]MDQ0337585.1 uncharacterized membrane protein YcaP (DUF421 family) [Caldalkalibacillus uzonensis]
MIEESLVVIVRALISFFTLLIYTRLLGKQQMGNLTYFDYINGITIGSMAGTLATDLSTEAWVHWLGLTVFVSVVGLLQYTDLKNRYLSKVVDSEPVVVIQNGKILENNLKTARVTRDELFMQLRQKNMFDITQVQYAILEPDGNFSVLPKAAHQPVTPKDLNIPVQPAEMMTEVIHDGVVLKQNLEQRSKDMAWLRLQLKAQGIQDPKEVSFAAILPNGLLYVDKFEDRVSNKADISDYKGPF